MRHYQAPREILELKLEHECKAEYLIEKVLEKQPVPREISVPKSVSAQDVK